MLKRIDWNLLVIGSRGMFPSPAFCMGGLGKSVLTTKIHNNDFQTNQSFN